MLTKIYYISFVLISTYLFSYPIHSADLNGLKIVFGSCLHQDKPSPILAQITREKPDYFFLLGDTIYLDSLEPEEKRVAYQKQFQNIQFRQLTKQTKIRAIWDDHDYGINDSGGEYEKKFESRNLFLEFFGKLQPKHIQPGTKNEEGIFFSEEVLWKGKRIQFIFLDTRYFRSPLRRSFWSYFSGKKQYVADDSKDKSMLGDEQWEWLSSEMKKKVDFRILVSGIQVISQTQPFEKWENFSAERIRLLNLIQTNNPQNTILISGDRHIAEIYQYPMTGDFKLTEVTSSSLNLPLPFLSLDYDSEFKLGEGYPDVNYGVLEIDFKDGVLNWNASIRSLEGKKVMDVSK
ncbi:alkaline phosphatase D family protein [Leptospira sp. 96542]|nr:alkaline phosphatase D family protein [Leptospira sp. 96542]